MGLCSLITRTIFLQPMTMPDAGTAIITISEQVLPRLISFIIQALVQQAAATAFPVMISAAARTTLTFQPSARACTQHLTTGRNQRRRPHRTNHAGDATEHKTALMQMRATSLQAIIILQFIKTRENAMIVISQAALSSRSRMSQTIFHPDIQQARMFQLLHIAHIAITTVPIMDMSLTAWESQTAAR